MDNMTSYSVLSGIFGTIAAGQDVQRKARADATKRAQELSDQQQIKAYESGLRMNESQVTTLGNALTKDARTAFSFLTSGEFATQRSDLMRTHPTIYAAVEATALGDIGFSKAEQAMIDSAKQGTQNAFSILESDPVKSLPDTDPFKMVVQSYAYTPGLSEKELDLLNGVTYENAQTMLKGMTGINQTFDVLENPMHPQYAFFKALSSIKKPAPEYVSPLNSDTTKLIDKALAGGNVEDALSNIDSITGSINNKFTTVGDPSYSAQAVADVATLNFLKASIGTKDPSNVETARDVINRARTAATSATTQPAQAQAATLAVQAIEDSFDDNVLKDPSVAGEFAALRGIAETAEAVANGTQIFMGNDQKPVIQVADFEDLFSGDIKKVEGALNKINGNPNISAAYDKMNATSKEHFENGIKTAIRMVYDDDGKQRTSVGQEGKLQKFTRPPRDFSVFSNNLYEFQFVKDYLHGGPDAGGLNIPEYGTTRTNAALLPDQGTLPPNILRDEAGEHNLSEDVVAFASKKGFDRPSDMIRGNHVYKNAWAKRKNELFTGMNLVHDSGAFSGGPSRAVDARVYDDLSFGMARLGVRGGSELMSVIAGNMPADIPPALQPRGGRGVNAAQVRSVLSSETGMNIDLGDIGTNITNNTNFSRNLREALSRARSMGQGSRFEDGFRSAYFNIVGSENSFINRATGAIENAALGDFVRLEDMQTEDDYGVSNESNRRGVSKKAESFLETEWAKSNAQLASLYVTLAYDFAKTMDPSGRISERDFAAALESISGSIFAPRAISIGLMESFLDRAEQNVFFQQEVFGITSKFMGDDVYYKPTPSDMQLLRGLRHYREVNDRMQDQMNIDLFKRRLSRATSYNSQDMNDYYVYVVPTNLPDELLDNPNLDIREVRKRVSGMESASLYMGKPVYVNVANDNPRILSIKEVQQFGLGESL